MNLSGLESIPSPALLFDADEITRNLRRMTDMTVGDPSLLRPHIKTHKCAEILKQQLNLGIQSVKCATLTEANLAAKTGVTDILISYPLVGPNVARLSLLSAKWPETQFSTVVDSLKGVEDLESVEWSLPLGTLIDLDVGMPRTGIRPGDAAISLVNKIKDSGSLKFAGVHAYDGHIHAADPTIRLSEFDEAISVLKGFLSQLDDEGIEIPMIVSGGTPTFAYHAAEAMRSERIWQCSPGTPVLWDAGYGEHYPDLPFEPAAFLLSRVVSRPGRNLACLDLGHKAVSAENPIENRVRFPSSERIHFVSQSEEHLVIQTSSDAPPNIGDAVLGIPYHVCPCVALYDEAYVIRKGMLSGETWPIEARSRVLDS